MHAVCINFSDNVVAYSKFSYDEKWFIVYRNCCLFNDVSITFCIVKLYTFTSYSYSMIM